MLTTETTSKPLKLWAKMLHLACLCTKLLLWRFPYSASNVTFSHYYIFSCWIIFQWISMEIVCCLVDNSSCPHIAWPITSFLVFQGHSRDVYHTKRMFKVSCVLWSGDNKFILSGSSDHNVRLWKSQSNEKMGIVSKTGKFTLFSDNLLIKI